jgi:uncharacterized protein (DUF488 family)
MVDGAGEGTEVVDEAFPEPTVPIFTVGLGTRALDEFLELLRHYGIEQVVDVRSAASSVNNPDFDKKNLSPFLRIRRIKYLHLKELGGIRRHVRESAENAGWRNASMRGFADYMNTPAFKVAINRLVTVARTRVTAILCMEASPSRCHRLLIADALLVRGLSIVHIYSKGTTKEHTLTTMARVAGTAITYPSAESEVTEPLRES